MKTKEEEERYRALFENSPIPMWEEDFSDIKAFLDALKDSGVAAVGPHLERHPELVRQCTSRIKVLDVNRRAREFYGAASKDDLAEVLPALFDEAACDVFREEIVALESGRPVFDAEMAARTLRGERKLVDMWVSLVPAPGPPWSRVIVSFIDVTERRRMEEIIHEARKLESLGRLAGGVAHDFNNLLTVINGYAELLLTQLDEGSPLREQVEEIRRAGERAAALTHDLLAFGRRQVLRPALLDLNGVIRGAASMLRRLAGEGVRLAMVLDPELGRVLADPAQIEQILVNLVANARDAMPGGGHLIIETHNAEFDADYIKRHPEAAPGSFVLLSVSDTGVGLDEDTKARLFEPFFTTKETGKGVGLGLSTVFGIVKQSGGHIWVYSELGHGTAFKIYLPRAERESASP